MADVSISIGHKDYVLPAHDGEEKLLLRAAKILDTEAISILQQAGRLPEARMLLMVSLMIADKYADATDRADRAERHLNRLQTHPPRVEVPVVPSDLKQAMAELATRAESLAGQLEDQAGR